MPAGRGLPTRIRMPLQPKMIIRTRQADPGPSPSGRTAHQLAGISLHAHGQRAALIQALHDLDLSLVYFFCHCRSGDGHSVPGPYLEIGKEQITPNDLARDDVTSLGFWRKNSPLVFINGCQTAAITLDSSMTLLACSPRCMRRV